MVDLVKLATKAAIRTAVLLALIIFVVNAFLVGMLPDYIAAIPVEMTLPIFLALFVAVIVEDWLEKNVLSKYI